MGAQAERRIGELVFYTPLQIHYLRRLVRLAAIRRERGPLAARDTWLADVASRTFETTMRDCVAAGIGDVARSIAAER